VVFWPEVMRFKIDSPWMDFFSYKHSFSFHKKLIDILKLSRLFVDYCFYQLFGI